jgi:hypothetical protein
MGTRTRTRTRRGESERKQQQEEEEGDRLYFFLGGNEEKNFSQESASPFFSPERERGTTGKRVNESMNGRMEEIPQIIGYSFPPCPSRRKRKCFTDSNQRKEE